MQVIVTFIDGQKFNLSSDEWMQIGESTGLCKREKLLIKNIYSIEYVNELWLNKNTENQ